MAGLADFRQAHPEYDDMPDAALSDALYKKFYSDMPREQFDAKMGAVKSIPLAGATQARNPQAQQKPPTVSITAKNPVPHTGYAAQVAQMAQTGPDKGGPARSFGEIGQSYADVIGGMATGMPAGVPGAVGDTEALGRGIANRFGANISANTIAPTSERWGDAIAGGPPANEDVASGRYVGSLIGPTVGAKVAKTVLGPAARVVAGAGPTESAKAAHDAGYALPPSMVSKKPGLLSQGLSMMSGKVKLQQAASAKNQEVTNRLASEALGLAPDTVLGDEAFDAVRADANQSYRRVVTSTPQISTDLTFAVQARTLGNKAISEAAKAFPELVKNGDIETLRNSLATKDTFSPQAGIELVRHLRSDAVANLKAFSDPGKQALGLAQRQAADAIDDLIERRLSQIGKPDVVNEYRAARQQLARTYDVETATDAAGNVNARIIGALQKKGRPLTGQLKDIADAARNFPKATQSPAAFGGTENLGILDAGAAAISHGATLPLSVARPGVRATVLSAPYQRMLMRPAGDPGVVSGYVSQLLALPHALRPEQALNPPANRPE